MTAPLSRPRFTRAYLTSLGKSFDERGFRSLVPGWLLSFAGLGIAVAFTLPTEFWKAENQPVSVVVYTGLLTLNGLILALSWSAFSRIHECISADRFGLYLFEKDLLGDYIVYIGYVHATQVLAIIVSAASLFSLLYVIPILWERVALAATVCFSAYAIKYAAASVTIMHDLIWQKAIFERHSSEEPEASAPEESAKRRVVVIQRET